MYSKALCLLSYQSIGYVHLKCELFLFCCQKICELKTILSNELPKLFCVFVYNDAEIFVMCI